MTLTNKSEVGPAGDASLRPMTARDLPVVMELKNLAGWNQTEADWRRYLAVYPAGCLAALHNDRLVGTVITAWYGDRFAWISMMLVHPEFRSRGIGRRLMEQALANAAGCPLIGLDATALGRPLYAKLGFVDSYTIQRMVHPRAGRLREAQGEVRALRHAEWSALFALDRLVFGADRTALLSCLVNERPDLARVLCHQSHLSGACLGRNGSNYTQIGPVIAAQVSEARSLVAAAMDMVAGQPAVIDVPDSQPEFGQWLREVGFVPQRTLWRMFHGQARLTGDAGRQYAIAGPDLG
jgi:GNAT superfamily N-acetyltransferase